MGVPDQRADQVLELVGLTEAGRRAAGGFSLGMKQRLALATALLGDPQVLVLDEPANGLDPEGIAWLRAFLQSYARTGRTVLISSHLLAEIEQTVDQVVIISRGQTVYYGSLDYLRQSQQTRVLVQAADPQSLVAKLQEAGVNAIEPTPDGRLAITGVDRKTVADLAMAASIALYDIQQENVDLEQLFFRLTQGQYTGQQPGYGAPAGYGPPPGAGGYGPPPQGYGAPQGTPGYAVPGTPPQGYAPPGTPPQGYAPPAAPPQYQQPGQQYGGQPYAPPQDQQQAAPPPEQPPSSGWGGNA